jgi:hypothetical protein
LLLLGFSGLIVFIKIIGHHFFIKSSIYNENDFKIFQFKILLHLRCMFNKLKQKWKVGWLQFTLIFCTFALGGSSCARLGNYLLSFILTEKSVVYWLMYVPLITLLWPICVLIISIPLGQFGFFKNYLSRIWNKIKGGVQ